MAGIPTTVVTRQGFEQVVINAFTGFGFPDQAPVTYIFPTEMFLSGSDLTPIDEHYEEMLRALTDWAPEPYDNDVSAVKTIDVVGETYAEAYANFNERFLRSQWGDDLPLVPPTEEYVDWILTGTELEPDEIIGAVPPRNGVCTVRLVAIALAMAGGRPEYLPVLIAATKAMTAAGAGMQSWNATTNSVFPIFVLNGPIAKQIRMNSGYGLLGPNPIYPAGQILGRAVRIMQQDIGGALPGSGTMAIFGEQRATNAFFTEDSDNLPEGWTTWAQDRGFSADQNVVSLTMALGAQNLMWYFGDEETNLQCLNAMAGLMAAPDRNRYSHPDRFVADNPDLPTGAVLIPKAVAQSLSEINGMGKEDVKQYLWENSFTPYENLEKWGVLKEISRLPDYADIGPGDSMPYCPLASQVTVFVCGGAQGGHGLYMGMLTQGAMQSVEVSLPGNWDELIKDSESDLGAIPES